MSDPEGSSRTCGTESRWFSSFCLDPHTLRFKLLYVTLFAGVVVVWVQLGPYQKSLGLSERDTGVMSIVGSSMILVGPVFSGIWADFLGDFRRLVAATALLNGIVAFGFTLVPPSPFIENISLKTGNSSVNLCPETLNSSGDNLAELHHSPDLDQSLNLNESKLLHDYGSGKFSSLMRELMNEPRLTTDLLQPGNDSSSPVVMLQNNSAYYVGHNASFLHYNLSDFELEPEHALSYETNDRDARNFTEQVKDNGEITSALEKSPAKSPAQISRCGTEMQSEERHQNGAKAITYWTYLFLHASFMLLNSATISLFESAVLAAVAEHNINYGRQRCFASAAATVSAPVGGLLVDLTGSQEDRSNYRTVLYTSCSLMLVSSVLLFNMDMKFKNPAKTRLKGLPAMFANVRLVALFFVTFLAGLLMGYGETFVYRYLHGLGASGSLLGATVTVGGVLEGVLLIFLSHILKFTGVYFCFAAGFVCFALKFLGLYLLHNPMYALLLEALDSVSTGMFMAVASLHLTSLVSCDAIASMRGLLGTTYMGVGKMAGAAVGTAVVKVYGTRVSWAILSTASGSISVLLVVGALFYRYFAKPDLAEKNSNRSLETVCSE